MIDNPPYYIFLVLTLLFLFFAFPLIGFLQAVRNPSTLELHVSPFSAAEGTPIAGALITLELYDATLLVNRSDSEGAVMFVLNNSLRDRPAKMTIEADGYYLFRVIWSFAIACKDKKSN